MENLTITKEKVLAAASKCSTASGILKTMFPEAFDQKITDRIKTFKDACKDQGLDPDDVLPYSNPKNNDQKAANAFMKITIIARSYNEGWKPDWTNSNEYKYYPYFIISGSCLSFCLTYYWNASTFAGSRLCFRTRELAEHVGKNFISEYTDLMIL